MHHGLLEVRVSLGDQVTGPSEPVRTAEGALELLRSVPGPRTAEFLVWTDTGDHFVFSTTEDEPFAHGFYVDKTTGAVGAF